MAEVYVEALPRRAAEDRAAVLSEQLASLRERLGALEDRMLRLDTLVASPRLDVRTELATEVEKRFGVLEHRLLDLLQQQAEVKLSSDALHGTSLELQQSKADAKDVVELLDSIDGRLACKVDTAYVDMRFSKMQQFVQRKAADIESRMRDFDRSGFDGVTDQLAAVEKDLAAVDHRLRQKADAAQVFSCLDGIRRQLQGALEPPEAGPPEAPPGAAEPARGPLSPALASEAARTPARSSASARRLEAMHATKRRLLGVARICEEEQLAGADARAARRGAGGRPAAEAALCHADVAAPPAAAPRAAGRRAVTESPAPRGAAGEGDDGGGPTPPKLERAKGRAQRCSSPPRTWRSKRV